MGDRASIEVEAGPDMCAGRVERGFELVQERFAEVVRKQPGTGAATAVWLDGRWLVDLWGGTVDVSGGRDWGPDSIVQPYSVTKPFVAVCALRLVERGALDLDAPVQRYWPEFTARATVRHLLSHQAGVVALDTPAPTDLFFDWDAMCSRLAAQPPLWEPGTAHGESALFYGHLVGELVRRIDGRSIGEFLRDEVCAPLGLDFAIGLGSADQARAVELTGLDELRVPATDELELYRRAVVNPPGARDPVVVNSARWRAAQIPAVNGHGTARAIAGFYAALLTGRVLGSTLLTEATSVHASGIDQVFGHDNAFGLGFGVDANGFGMGGLGGSYGGASRDGYAIGFVTGSMGTHDRATSIENALRSCLGLPELID
jgi:CubicO group peptidase (beta-lactamase class C family)